jgi:type IV secretion system protein VirB6
VSFLSEFEAQITTAFSEVVAPTTANVIAAFQPVFVVGFSVWVLMIAYDVAWGRTEDGVTYLLTKIGKVFLACAFALFGWGMLQELASAVQGAFVHAVSCANGDICGSTVSSVLEVNLLTPLGQAWANLWANILETFSITDLFGIDGLTKLLMVILTILGYGLLTLCVGLLSIITLAMYMVAYATFQLLLCVGPFFLMCAAFPAVQRFFESWVGAAMTAVLAMAFTALLAVLSATALGLPEIVQASQSSDLGSYDLVVSYVSKGGFGMLLIYLYYKVFDLAAALGGGLNLGNNLAGAMRTIARDAMRQPRLPQGSGAPSRTNTVSLGSSGGGNANEARRRATLAESLQARQTFTGMAIAGTAHLAGSGLRSVAKGVSAAGRFAYNRGAPSLRSRSA